MASPFVVGATSVGFATLAGLTTLEDQKNANEMISLQVEQEAEASLYRLGMTQNEIKEVDRELALAFSKTEIQSMKDEAFAKAYTASSGLSGTTAKDIEAEASVEKSMKQTDLKEQAGRQQRQLLSSMFQEKMQFDQRSEMLLESMQTPESAGMQAFTSTIQGYQTGLSLFSQGDVASTIGSTGKKQKTSGLTGSELTFLSK